jgi:hypothetical protein
MSETRKRKATKRKTLPKASRPFFTRQEYATIIDCLSTVKMISENSPSLPERRGARAMIPHSDYHVRIIDKLCANTAPEEITDVPR